MKLGMIVRANDKGLGNQSKDFYDNLKPYKTICVWFSHERTHKDWYPDAKFIQGMLTDADFSYFNDCDVVLSFERFYSDFESNDHLKELSEMYGFTAVLQPNYEQPREQADFYLPATLWHFNEFPDPKKYLPFPINSRIVKKERTQAKRFVHNVGIYSHYDRQGTMAVLKALDYIKSDVKIVLRVPDPNTWKELGIKEPHHRLLEIDYTIKDDINDLYDGDVLLYPRLYGGLSLPINEALGSGMPVICSDMNPQNTFLPKEWLIPAKISGVRFIGKVIEYGIIDPKDVAEKVDWFATSCNYKEQVKRCEMIQKEWSWEKLKPQYIQTLYELK